MKLIITQSRYTFPTLTSDKGMVGTVRKMEDAEYIINAVNQYPELLQKIKRLEEENRRLKEATINE